MSQEQTINKDELMRDLDKESNTRIWTGIPKIVNDLIVIAFSVYCIWSTLFSVQALQVRLTSFLACIIIVGFLNYPASKKHVKENYIPWYDIVLMILGAGSFFYYCFAYQSLAHTLTSASKMTAFLAIVGIVGIAVLVELCRRCVGVPILCVAGALVIYTFIVKFQIDGTVFGAIKNMLFTLFYSTGGVIGTPVQVCAKFIAIFIIFGAFLERTGIANFFIDCANSLVGSASGGPAKVAVISSALCGMVSGSSVGNTVTTGSVTIPMMKKTGYKPEFAGAVEAAASTGGQIMPPIMGAAAFLMAEYMGIPYGKVIVYAILPAILYFLGILVAVHLEAKKLGLKGIPKEMLPKWKNLVKKLYLLIPLVVLVWLVAGNYKTLAFSASISIICAILVAVPEEILTALKEKTGAIGFGKRFGGMIFDSLAAGGKSCVTVVIACCMAGVVAGCITATGLASKLIAGVVNFSSMLPGTILPILVALVLTMLCCIVLGMGVPTTANYCIMASTCAPILITLGIDRVAAHFFVFYFGIVADITPPVALAAFAGSAIAKSNPLKTGINATKLAVAAFVVPYIFAINPSMLMMNDGILSAILVCVTSVLGVVSIAAALNGFVETKLPVWERLILVAAGITMLIPGWLTDVIGIVMVAIVAFEQFIYQRNKKKAQA